MARHTRPSLAFAMFGFAIATGTAAPASSPNTVESALAQFCEPLIAGSAAKNIANTAQAAGFKTELVGGQSVLVDGQLILGVSDAPRVCFIQAPTSMTYAMGISLVDTWAARHPGAMRGAATKGPDGAPVKMWVVPKQGKYLLMSQQTTAGGQAVLNFILAPLSSN